MEGMLAVQPALILYLPGPQWLPKLPTSSYRKGVHDLLLFELAVTGAVLHLPSPQ